MLHHVALEVRADRMAADGEFWLAAGFVRVPVPEALGEGFDWFERGGTQIHLMAGDDPSRPPARGHAAVVAPDFDETLARIEGGGFEVREARRLWGARRAKARTPSGHVVELMAAPPAAEAGS